MFWWNFFPHLRAGFSKHTSEDDFTGGDAVVAVFHKKRLAFVGVYRVCQDRSSDMFVEFLLSSVERLGNLSKGLRLSKAPLHPNRRLLSWVCCCDR